MKSRVYINAYNSVVIRLNTNNIKPTPETKGTEEYIGYFDLNNEWNITDLENYIDNNENLKIVKYDTPLSSSDLYCLKIKDDDFLFLKQENKLVNSVNGKYQYED